MSIHCPDCGAVAGYGHELAHRSNCPSLTRKRGYHLHQPSSEHHVAYQDLCALMNKHPDLSALELLAIAANMIGKLMAMQDQRTISSDLAMEVLIKNLELGNQQAVDQLSKSAGNA